MATSITSHRIFDFVEQSAKKNADAIALAHRKKGEWSKVTYGEFEQQSNIVSNALLGLNVGKGDMIGSVSLNRAELNFLDIGILQTGAVHIALNPAYSLSDMLFIISQTEVSYLFCGNRMLYKLLYPHVKDFPFLKGVYCMEDVEDVVSWSTILTGNVSENDLSRIEKAKSSVSADDVATIIYTSGTGGNPKGAVHTHASLGAFAEFLYGNYGVQEGDIVLSLLSVSHSFERLHYCFYMKQGMAIYYADGGSALPQQIQEVKPHMIVCVPLIIESLYKFLIASANTEELKAALAYTQLFESKTREEFYASEEYKNHEPVYQKWRNDLGGAFKQIITGAAMIPEYLVRFFWAIKIPLFECYGSTEALLHTINHEKHHYKPGTVGQPPVFAQVKISADNEILMKSKSCMLGYYKIPDLTKEVLDEEGWYHSGDLGSIDEDGFLSIRGRANTIFKLLNGKYLNPEHLEQTLSSSPFIKSIFITLDNNLHLSAVIIPNATDVDASVQKAIAAHINEKYNYSVGESEQIKKMLLVSDTWAVSTGEYTPTMKLKRKVLLEKYLPMFHQSVSI